MFLKICLVFMLFACGKNTTIKTVPIENFNVEKYLGTWHEIARVENHFEKNCTDVTAEYSLRQDGKINIENKCTIDGKQKIAKGKAYFAKSPNVGLLKVTFFWPFYANYNISYIDENYQYAIVDGGSSKYFWILARNKTIDNTKMQEILAKVREIGINPQNLTYAMQIKTLNN